MHISHYHKGKPIPLGTFVLRRNFSHANFFDKPKHLRIGPYKILDRISDVTYEPLPHDGSILHVHRNHLIPYYPKEPLLYPHFRISQTQPIITFQNRLNMQIVTLPLLILLNPYPTSFQLSKPLIQSITSSTNLFSKDKRRHYRVVLFPCPNK